MAQYGKKDLIDRLSDYIRKGWTNQQVKDLIDSLWRDPWSPRTSGFELAGGADCGISAEATMTEINGNPFYSIAFQITPINKRFAFYQYRTILSFHKKYTSEYLSWAAEEGLFAVYYDYDKTLKQQTLHWLHNPTHDDYEELFSWVVPIMFIYYDAENNQILYRGNNKHGSLWNPWIHFPWHQTFNSMRETGLEFTDLVADGDGSENAHAQFGVSAGTCFHEDIYVEPSAQTAPVNFQVWYFNSTGKPRIYDGSVNSLVVDGLLCYNSGGEAVPADDGYFVMYHIFFSNDILEPFLSVMGQDQYEKVSQATLMIDVEVQQVRDMLPHQNLLHIGTLIFQTSVAFTNSYKSRIVSQAYGVITRWSVEGDGSAATPVQLKNDEETPTPGKVYSAHYSTGEKGYHFLDPRLFGWGQAIYLHLEASAVSGYKKALPVAPDVAEDAITVAATSADGEKAVEEFVTESDYPGVTNIPAGPWMFDIWAAVSTDRNCSMKVYVYKRASGGTETELFNFTLAVTAVGISQHFYSTPRNALTLLATDRLAWKVVFINPTSTSTTFYLGLEGIWASNVRIPLATVTPMTFLDLTDTPDSYTDQAGKVPVVNEDEDGLEFVDFPDNSIGVEDIAFDWNDVEEGVSQTWVLDPKASFAYNIISVVLESDSTMDDLAIKIDGTAVGGMSAIDVTTSTTETSATSGNSVSEGSRVTMVSSGTDGAPTLIRGKLKIQRT